MTNETITAYPLQWPSGWKRTPTRERERARFNRKEFRATDFGGYRHAKELSVTDGIGRVLSELRAFGVGRDNIIISTNLDVRLDGLPRSGQRTPTDPGAAVYWTRNREQRCIAIDQYDKVADNLAAIAATLGAMRAIERHGGAEILDRAFLGFAAIAAPAGSNWWEVLNVERTASQEEIRLAYRNLAKANHPDVGGDAEKFVVITKAYEAAVQSA